MEDRENRECLAGGYEASGTVTDEEEGKLERGGEGRRGKVVDWRNLGGMND